MYSGTNKIVINAALLWQIADSMRATGRRTEVKSCFYSRSRATPRLSWSSSPSLPRPECPNGAKGILAGSADFRQGLWDAARRRKHCILATIYSGKTTAFGQGRITAREPRFTCFDSGRPTRPGKNIAVHVGPSISSSPLFASLPLVRPPDFLFLRLRREAHITCVTRLALTWFLMRTYLGSLCASQPSV